MTEILFNGLDIMSDSQGGGILARRSLLSGRAVAINLQFQIFCLVEDQIFSGWSPPLGFP